jgi:DNA-binding NtrC family response regulator
MYPLKISKTTTGIQLVLTDVTMPSGMDGCHLARNICALYPDLPSLYMTGGINNAVENTGAKDINMLQKPIRPKVQADNIRHASQPV